MAFSDFVYPAVIQELGLTQTSAPDLFGHVPSVAPGPTLQSFLPRNVRLATAAHSEASRSIWMVGPVLADLWGRYDGRINMFAGIEFAPDPANGLSGYCDFLIGRGPQLPNLVAPVAVIFEAKRDSIPGGLGQCVAGMVGLQRFNRREGTPIDPVYGCVTTGSLWKFLRLAGTTVTIDLTEYMITQVDRLLGILAFMAGPLPEPAAA